ncbi:hypothetical protein ACYZX9_15295 [Sphingomonas citri]|uniref:Uncharacterized protein n=1 Tax=Sphingomonas citri TaxID=2862499 RepID=A0ABS7BTM1_9SPHN|nr:hypothetical protein [Sphingomonas citri]MBW6532946.1 hypothetical protein [Sphingomonas citri]
MTRWIAAAAFPACSWPAAPSERTNAPASVDRRRSLASAGLDLTVTGELDGFALAVPPAGIVALVRRP